MFSGNTYERTVGRLIEIRIDEGFRSIADVDAMVAASRTFLDPLPPHERVIIAADWRRCSVLAADTIDRVVEGLVRVNPRVLRSALLVPPSSPASVRQLIGVVSETKLRERQVFASPSAMTAWLAEVTTPKEQARLEAFLARTNSESTKAALPSSSRQRTR